jgi:hypothetical protein
LASRRLRAYEPDRLDGSVLWFWLYTYTHADSDNYLHAPHANGNGYRNASNANANGNVHFNPKTIPNSKVHSATKTSPHSSAATIGMSRERDFRDRRQLMSDRSLTGFALLVRARCRIALCSRLTTSDPAWRGQSQEMSQNLC